MARDPGSVWSPLPEAGAPDGLAKTQFIVHSTGTRASAAANFRYFTRGDVQVESTFIIGLGPEDPTLQIMDSTDRADANGNANGRAIALEVVGEGGDPFTDWQIREIIRIGIWAHRTHGISLRIIPSEPAGGYGWHVMFGAPGPWTSVVGKVCPGSVRIRQLKSTVFPAIFSGTAPIQKPAATAPVLMEDNMAVIQSPGRGHALVGPGIFEPLTGEEAAVAPAAFGPLVPMNDRQFDVTRALALRLRPAGTAAAAQAPVDVDEVALAAALAEHIDGVDAEQIEAAVRRVLERSRITAA